MPANRSAERGSKQQESIEFAHSLIHEAAHELAEVLVSS